MRFGIAPILRNHDCASIPALRTFLKLIIGGHITAAAQAKVLYYLSESYGIAAAIHYFELVRHSNLEYRFSRLMFEYSVSRER